MILGDVTTYLNVYQIAALSTIKWNNNLAGQNEWNASTISKNRQTPQEFDL